MKKLNIGLSVLLGTMLLSGCTQDNVTLKVSYESFRMELGNPILKSAEYYIDKVGMEEEDLQKLYKETKVDFQSNKDDLINNEYEKNGTYHMTLTYKDQVKDFDIVVKDTSVPQIKGDDILYVKTKSKMDYKSLYKVEDYNNVEDLIIDDSQVNLNQEGNYKLFLSVKDKAGNLGEKEVIVKVQDVIKKKKMKEKVFMDIPYYNQIDVDAPNGCETTSIYMALKYKNKIDIDVTQFIDDEPRADNPYDGFFGDPFGKPKQKDDYYTIFPTPLVEYTSQYTKCKDISGASVEEIKRELANDHPVAVWATSKLVPARERTLYFGKVISNLHVVLLNGYDDSTQTFNVLDPIYRDLKTVSYNDFSKAYDLMKFAVSVE